MYVLGVDVLQEEQGAVNENLEKVRASCLPT